MTLRQIGNKFRKLLSGYHCKVSGRTVSFEGFGFGSAGFIDIECAQPLPDNAIAQAKQICQELPAETKIIVSLTGFAYPFGYKLS
jgi:hypothetical protein